jgi:hypothetical protein
MIFKILELIPEQERLSNKKSIDWVCKILDKNDINTCWHSGAVRGNTLDHEKENEQYSYLEKARSLSNEHLV